MSTKLIVVDPETCTGCRLCEFVCSLKHDGVINPGRSRIRVITWNKDGTYVPISCQQCQNAPCISACPRKAIYRDNIIDCVIVNSDLCIGCKMCVAACPFGARSFNFRNPRPFIKEENKSYPTRMKGVVEKCNFCAERLAVGKMPKCVEVSNGIITFGDLNDPESEVRSLLNKNYTIRRKQELGSGPSVYYIV